MSELAASPEMTESEAPAASPPARPRVTEKVRQRSPAFGVGLAAIASVAAHAAFAFFMLSAAARTFEEERGAGAKDQIWGLAASSVGVEMINLNMEESVASPAEKIEEITEPIKPLEEVETSEPTELPVEEIEPVEETRTAEVAEAKPVEAETLKQNMPEEFSPIQGSAEAENLAGAPKHVEELKPEDEVVLKKSPPPKQEIASIDQAASGGPVGVAAGQGGEKEDAIGEAELSSYSGLIAAHLRRHKRYPREAERKRIQGIVRIHFSVGEKGEILGAEIVASSGSPLLDDEALAMVSRAQPFPPLPKKLRTEELHFTVPVRFQP